MNRFLYLGEGKNLKTGKPVKFRIPDCITDLGLESIQKNLEVNKYDINPNHPHFQSIPKHVVLSAHDSGRDHLEEREVRISRALILTIPGLKPNEMDWLWIIAAFPERGKRAFQILFGKSIKEASIQEMIDFAYDIDCPRETSFGKRLPLSSSGRIQFRKGDMDNLDEDKSKSN